MSCPFSHPTHTKEEILADLQVGEGPAKCTYKAGQNNGECPHGTTDWKRTDKIYDSILDHVGNTPMVRINTLTKEMGIECEVLAKCEFFNAGGSVKDRIGKRMIIDAEKSGRIKKGDTLIEPTSGNTGIGLALAAALKGYRMIITLPEKMSQEKVDVLKALGAEIIRTPTEAAFDSPDSHIGVANRLNKEIPNSHILDQYSNPSNPMAHYDGTAEEMLYQCDEKIDVCVMSVGTGGTISGTARKLKERLPNIKIIGVDPNGSILALPESLNGKIYSYKVEGIGYDFIPKVLDRPLIDQWLKTDDPESFRMSRSLIKKEGLLCGGSAGATMAAALEYAKTMKKGQRMVVLLADSVRNYMSKFLNDQWMIDNEFMEAPTIEESAKQWWFDRAVTDLKLQAPVTVGPTVTCQEAVNIMKQQGYDQMPVLDKDGGIVGVVTLGNLNSKIMSGRVSGKDPVSEVVYKTYKKVTQSTTLGELSGIFNNEHFALVVATQRCFETADTVTEKTVVCGVATRIDLLNFVFEAESKQ